MRSCRLFLALLVVFALAGADWPRFRGPNGTGVVTDPGVPSAAESGDIRHKVALPGRGNSSPIISKGKLFLTAAADDGQGRMLICYDAKGLKHLWTKHLAGGTGKTHAKNSLASSTPVADGQRVVALFWDGTEIALHAFDYDGKSLWRVPLGGFTSQHGPGQSPVIHEGKVFLNNDQDGKSEFMAFNIENGDKLWSAKRTAFRSCYSSPYIRPDGRGGSEVLIASTAGITAYDPDSGKVRWEWEWFHQGDPKPLRNVGSPVEGPGVIFAIAGDGDGSRDMIAVTPPGGTTSEPKLAWEKKQPRYTPYVPCPLVKGEHIYWVNDGGFAACVEAKTGKVVYDERLAASGITASPLLVNDHVLCVDERGNLYTYPAEPKLPKPHKLALGENVYATPAVADGMLYIRGEKSLFVIGKKKTEK